jgi:hypothetical protein
MRNFHLVFGALIVIAFLLTGQYMDKYHGHLEGMPDGPRLLYRTRHIFILLSGLLHLGLGAYFARRLRLWRRVLQLSGSGLISVASLLFVVAFFYEPGLRDLHTPLSHWGAYTIAAGTLLHLSSGAGREAEANGG